jgi:hypothetical protein
MRKIDIGLIQAARRRLVTGIEQHRLALAALELELEKLSIAETVFTDLSNGEEEPSLEPTATAVE